MISIEMDCLVTLYIQVKMTPSLSEIKINERSLVKLYERTKTAITAPMYTASFFPGSRFPDVLREITSSLRINKSLWAMMIHDLIVVPWI